VCCPATNINEKFWQKQLFLVQRRVWVAGWLRRQYRQQQIKQPFSNLLFNWWVSAVQSAVLLSYYLAGSYRYQQRRIVPVQNYNLMYS
jgi:hypothetical protein